MSDQNNNKKLVARIIKKKPDSIDISNLLYFVLQVGECMNSIVGIFINEKEAISFAMRMKKKMGEYGFFVKGRDSFLSQDNISAVEICWEVA